VDKRFEDSRWPIVTLRFSEESTDEEWRTLMDCLRQCCSRRERFGVIADGARMKKMPTALQRKTGADLAMWIKERYPDPPWPIIAWGNVITSPLVRGAVTAILWVAAPPYPQKAFATWDEAYAWVKAEVAAARCAEQSIVAIGRRVAYRRFESGYGVAFDGEGPLGLGAAE
jgi:hypothetical protein